MTDLAAAPLAKKLLVAVVDALGTGKGAVHTEHAHVDLAGDQVEIIIANLQVIGPPLDEAVTRRMIMLFFKWFAECLLLNGDHGPRIERLLLVLRNVSPVVKEAFELAVGIGPHTFTITKGDETYHQWRVPAFPLPEIARALTRRRKDGAPTLVAHDLFSFNMALRPLQTIAALPPSVIAGCEETCKRWGNKTLLTRGTFVCVHITDLCVNAPATAINDVRDLRHIFWYLELYARTRFVPVVVSDSRDVSYVWNSTKDWRQDGPLPTPYFVPLANRTVAIWCPQTNGFFLPTAADMEEPAPSWAPPTPVVIVLDDSSSDEVFVVPKRAPVLNISSSEDDDAMELSLSEDVVTGEKIRSNTGDTDTQKRVTALFLECVLTGRHPGPMCVLSLSLSLSSSLRFFVVRSGRVCGVISSS